MSSFDVRIFAIRRRPGRGVFEVRWRVADRDKSRCLITRALADSYRAELVRAARKGLEFDPATGSRRHGPPRSRRPSLGISTRWRMRRCNGRTWPRIPGPAWPTRWLPSPRC
jgi:hypothetical protein